jgi:hypothetical protein
MILDKKGGLKVKIRNLLAVVAMLSVFIIGIGTAHAVLGVNDDVPLQDLVVPLICEKNGDLDTLFAIADKEEALCHYVGISPESGEFYVTSASARLYNPKSQFIVDWEYEWTLHDIVNDLCSRIFDEEASNPVSAEVTLGGKVYYAGYVTINQNSGGTIAFDSANTAYCADPTNWEPKNRFIGWQYLVDLTKGFASGFNMPGAENGLNVGGLMGEAFDNAPIAVQAFYPRFYFLNNKGETWNWWIYLFGQNELAVREPILYSNIHRYLDGIICDEQENCSSLRIPIPYEMMILNVLENNYIPGTIKNANGFPGTPADPQDMGGFALLDIIEFGTILFPTPVSIFIDGTFNAGFLLGLEPPFEYYSAHAWSYQRAESNDGLPGLSWDVIHPQHRTWCTVSDPQNGADCGPRD